MRTGRPIPPLTLTDDERDTLERWSRRPTAAQALAARARGILGCAAGQSNTAGGGGLRLTKQRNGKWGARFLGNGLYLNPPDKALVLCVDEKAQIQALDRTQPLLPM